MANLIPEYSPVDFLAAYIIDDILTKYDDFKNAGKYNVVQEELSDSDLSVSIISGSYNKSISQSEQDRIVLIQYQEKTSTRERNFTKPKARERAILFYNILSVSFSATFEIVDSKKIVHTLDMTIYDNTQLPNDLQDLTFRVDERKPDIYQGIFFIRLGLTRNPYYDINNALSEC